MTLGHWLKSVILAAVMSVGFSAVATAFDRNTPDAAVIIEQDEVGFLLFGKRVVQRLNPGVHTKMPFIQRVAVIVTSAERSGWTGYDVDLPTGETCEMTVEFGYVVADARKAFDWRSANGLSMVQDQSLFASPPSDYEQPSVVATAEAERFAKTISPIGWACGAAHSFDGSHLLDQINSDGTQITFLGADTYCSPEPQVRCHRTPPLNRSFSSSAPDSPHRMSPRQNQR